MPAFKLSGGDALEKRLKEISRNLEKPSKLRVGFLEGATYPDKNSTPVAQVAFWNNFGTGTAPPRPFFSNMVKDKGPGWPDALEQNLKATNYDAQKSMSLMGEGIASQLRDSIIDTNAPPLSPITVMLRGMKANDQTLVVTGKTVGEAAARVRDGKTNYGASTKPLIEHGIMLNAVDFEVES